MTVASRSVRSSRTVIWDISESLCPEVMSSLALDVLVLTCLCVMTIAVLSSPSNADQLSLSFDHFQKSSFESRWNSAAILNSLCGSGAGENRKRATTYNCGESICSRGGREGFLAYPQLLYRCARVLCRLLCRLSWTPFHSVGSSVDSYRSMLGICID